MTRLTSRQMHVLDRAIADLGRRDLAELLVRIRAARQVEFQAHLCQLVAEMAESRERRRARIDEISAEVRESKEEWQRQLCALQRLRWQSDAQGSRH